MKTQHTPGPWHVSQTVNDHQGDIFSHYWKVWNPEGDKMIADTFFTWGGRIQDEGEREANARLIAAAPELLAALEAALKALAYHEQNTATLRGIIANGSKPWAEVEKFDAEWNAHNGAYKAVESAIAKAKGAK